MLRSKRGVMFVVLFVVITVVYMKGYFGLWAEGMGYIANQPQVYSDKESHPVEKDFSMELDLRNLDSNIGKDLYNDGEHRIYVTSVDHNGSIAAGGYSVNFRSSGPYSLYGASLVSGVIHQFLDNHSFRSDLIAKMTTTIRGKSYESWNTGSCGINYRDGDCFSFTLFPRDAYLNKEVSLQEKGTVTIIIRGLYKNIWRKK